MRSLQGIAVGLFCLSVAERDLLQSLECRDYAVMPAGQRSDHWRALKSAGCAGRGSGRVW